MENMLMATGLPKRPKQHEIDTRGLSLLSYVLPKECIFRSLGERDYGIDGIIELAFGEQVSGLFLSAQLKSSENVHWLKGGDVRVSIPKTTCNYWMQNNMPVLLFLADLSTQKVYYGDVKAQLRQRYTDYSTNNNFPFTLSYKNELHFTIDQNIPNVDEFLSVYGYRIQFLALVLRMVGYSAFEADLKEFILNWKRYFNHLKHQNADPFLFKSIEFYKQTIHIHNCMLHISNELNLGMQEVDFKAVRNNLREMYDYYKATPGYDILEYEITVLHSQIGEYIEAVIRGIKNYILSSEKDFWSISFPLIYQEAQNMDWNATEY
jgi:hypothetical protein